MPQAAALNSQFLEQLRVRPLATVAEYYASCLTSTPAAIEYLKRHRLQCDSLPIGFADRSFPPHPKEDRQARKDPPQPTRNGGHLS